MTSINALQSGLNGVYAGMHSLNENATKIANNSGDITEAAVGMLSDKQQIIASAKVIETANTMLGSLLDVEA